MKKAITLVALLASLSLSLTGCVSPDKLVESHAPPSATNGYIGGLFSGVGAPVGASAYYVFVFTEQKTGKAYALPFFGPKEGGYHLEKFRLIEVPAGRYRFAYWASYREPFGEVLVKSEQAPGGLGDIDVVPSKVTLTGRFRVSDEYLSVNETVYVVTPLAAPRGEMAQLLDRDFPGYLLAGASVVSGK